MDISKVEDIRAGSLDATGAKILTVYSKITGVYAVYGTAERVMVQYADDPALGAEQRTALTPLNPLKGEINGLVDGWRNSAGAKDKCRARMFDRRTADALTTALQGDQAHAEELLLAVKADILEERTSIGRTAYLAIATGFTALICLAFLPIPRDQAAGIAGFIHENDLWLAAAMGCLGALFSIGLSIRAREIRTDLQSRDNVTDALLRIAIGAVSAVVLFSFLRSGFITLGLGKTPIVGADGSILPDVAIIVAFLAGFSERLVAGYLTRAAETATGEMVTDKATPAQDAAAKTEVEANELNPRGRQEVAAPGARSVPTPAAADEEVLAQAHDEHDVDGCACDIEIGEQEQTADEELPAASGGIAA